MKLVKLTESVGSRQAGEVLKVDDASAANLVENRKVATYFDPEKDEAEAERALPRRGMVSSRVLVDADEPNAPAASSTSDDDDSDDSDADEDDEDDSAAGDPPAPQGFAGFSSSAE